MPRIAAALSVLATAAFCIGFNIVRYPIVREKLAMGEHLTQSVESTEPAAAEADSWDSGDACSDDHPSWDDDSAEDDGIVASISGSEYYGDSGSSWDDTSDDFGDENDFGDGSDDYGGDDWSSDAWDDEYSSGGRDTYDSYDSYGTAGATQDDEQSSDRLNRSVRTGGNKGKNARNRKRSVDRFDSYASDTGDHEGLVPVARPGESAPSASESGYKSSGAWQSDAPAAATGRMIRRLPSVDDWEPGPKTAGPQSRPSVTAYPSTGVE